MAEPQRTPSGRQAVRRQAAGEELLFLRRWLAHPLKVGALLPSSPFLGRLVAKHVRANPDEYVVELGAGTGTVTKTLLQSGIPAARLFVVEIDSDLCSFLRRELPEAQIIQGDATKLHDLLPPEALGRIRTVVSGIPMLPMPVELQRRMLDSWFGVIAPGGKILQYTYSLASPIPEAKHGLKGKRCGIEMRNVPPAWVWSYERSGTPATRGTMLAA